MGQCQGRHDGVDDEPLVGVLGGERSARQGGPFAHAVEAVATATLVAARVDGTRGRTDDVRGQQGQGLVPPVEVQVDGAVDR